jgi:O-antigen/teichoic acid export membrane protein
MERFRGAFWTLFDQGAISLGSFLLNVGLARHLTGQEYGTFALLLGAFFMIQHFNASFIYYPLMMKLAGGKQGRPSDLVFTSLVLTALSVGVFSDLLTTWLIIFGRSDIAIAAGVYLVLWQLQDVMRRALLAQFSHRMAAIGDGIAYMGAAAGIGILVLFDRLTLSNALFTMAGSSALAIIVQVIQRPPTFPHASTLGDLLAGWALGKWAFVNGVILIATMQVFPWMLVAMDGPAAAANFQSVLNIANLANPITLGLSNIIMPAVAQAHATGSIRHAWRVASIYIIIGVTLLSFFVIPVMLMPETVLVLLYGANSPFANLSEAVNLMVLAVAFNAIADLMNQFIFGVGPGKSALWMNGMSLGVVIVLLPFLGSEGVAACALVLAAAKVVRLVVASCIVAQLVSSEDRPSRKHLDGCRGGGA